MLVAWSQTMLKVTFYCKKEGQGFIQQESMWWMRTKMRTNEGLLRLSFDSGATGYS